LIPMIRGVAVFLTGLTDAFLAMPKPMRSLVIGFLAAGAAAGPIVFVVGKLITSFGMLFTGIKFLVKGIHIFFLLMRAAPMLLGPWGLAITAIAIAAVLV